MPVNRLFVLAAGLAAGAFAACDSAPGHGVLAKTARPVVRIAHVWDQDGDFTPAVQAALASTTSDFRVDVVRSSVGVSNLLMVQRGEVDAASTFADIAYMGSVGQLPGVSHRVDRIRAIAALPIRPLQLVVGPGSSIRSIADLRGRRVSLGPAGGGIAVTATLLLSAFGVSPDEVRLEQLPFEDGARELLAGTLDAAFWGGRFPSANIATVTRRGARLLEVVGPEIERFRLEYPFLRAATIPARAHPGVDRPVHTVGVDGIFVCRADLDERLVYNLTKAFFQAVAHAGRDVPALRSFNMSRAASTPIPLHPGAARYYRELEMRR